MIDYPKAIDENLRFRNELLTKCEADAGLRAAIRETVRRDILFFFNVFCWAYDPFAEKRHGIALRSKNRPIITYPFQDDAIREINHCIEIGENLFIDKSRDMLATYMVLYTYLWRWLSKDSEEFRVGSRKEDYVDKAGDMDSLFEKLRYNLSFFPWFILPKGWNPKKHSPYMKLVNPENRSSIIGEATNRDFARGGRKVSVFYDEYQAWEMAEEAWKSASDSTRCKIVTGTPEGAGNKFAELARTDEVKHKLHLIWHLHPEKAYTSGAYLHRVKNDGVIVKGRTITLGKDQSFAPKGCYIGSDGKIRSEWYDEECARRNDKDIAENLDCNYLTSGDPVFDTEKCNLNLLRSKPPIQVGTLEWKVSPNFNTEGFCTNQENLVVEFVPNNNGWLYVWEHPVPEKWEYGYAIAADVAEGLEQGDYDSAGVLRRFAPTEEGKPTVVASIHGHMKTWEYSEMLVKTAVYYQHCVIAPERNNTMGGAVVENCFKLYNKLYFKEIFTKGYATRTDKMGWDTTGGNKGTIIGNLSKAISFDLYEDNDEGFWKETLTFIKSDGKMEAQGKSKGQKCFDDRVMGRAILLWIHNQLPLPARKFERVKHTGWRSGWNEPQQGSLIRF